SCPSCFRGRLSLVNQNWNRTANSACRDGALMFASSDVLVPNSGRPVVVSLPPPILALGVEKLARSKMLKSCAMNSARLVPMRKYFEKRRSTLANPGQSTVVTGVRLRAVLNALIASRFSDRQPDPGSTPGGRSPVIVSLFRSPAELDGENGRSERKSPIADTC